MESKEADATLQGQATIWQFMFSFADSMALKCAVEIHIADIINSHDGPISLPQIASCIHGSASPDHITYLARIMRLLVRRKLFTVHPTIPRMAEERPFMALPTHQNGSYMARTKAWHPSY
ncbi:hypothetical protein COLO4_35393 [Corchorus olitorius]|uniref:O-methyltransferase dimerisation domain-containing protein n=1 Tax=Corchorus olitorius TaxID=93759 RepID=A0A1R3GH93_9ROSI|nr:hypothetical protein COLO4_35393 [Corchorus olitorius]